MQRALRKQKIVTWFLCIGLIFASLFLILFTNSTKASAAFGDYTEYPGSVTDTWPVSITTGPDKKIWTTFSQIDTIGRLDPCNGAITEFSLPPHPTVTRQLPRHISVGQDGNLWFINGFSRQIGYITTDGVITILPQTMPGANISDLIYATDGNLWYIDFNGNTVYKRASDGSAIASYPVGTNPQSLIQGPDGNMWVLGGGSNNVTKINITTGVTTSYSIPGTYPYGLTTGPDGNMWLGTTTPAQVVRLTPSGTTTAYSIPSGAVPRGFTIGPDNNMWFALQNGGIGSINPTSGVINQYPFPNTTYRNAFDITTGPDNNIWYTNLNTFLGVVGKFDIGGSFDCEAPTTSLIAPSDNTIITGDSVDLTATSSDNTAVTKLEFYAGSDLIEVVNNPASDETISWNLSSVADGTYSLTTKAYDANGNGPGTSSPINVTVDRTKPVVTITSPQNNKIIEKTATLTATATDAFGINEVQFMLNNKAVGAKDTVAPYATTLDTTKYTNGTYTLTATAKDSSGNTTTSSIITVSIFNQTIVEVLEDPENEIDEVVETPTPTPTTPIPVVTSVRNRVTLIVQNDGVTVATVEVGVNLKDQNYEVSEKEVLIVDGVLGVVDVKKGGIIKGTGAVGKLTVQEGAFLAPGKSPGCLTSEGLTLEGTYTFQIAGKNPCDGYDQVRVNGTVVLKGSLSVELLGGFTPGKDDEFVILTNDGTEAVEGVFTGLEEGATVVTKDATYVISYRGGDGNDISLKTLTAWQEEANKDSEDTKPAASTEDTSFMWLLAGIVVVVLVTLFFNSRQPKK